jgi:ABC-2 type transport system permease protein
MSATGHNLRVIWACAKKDVRSALTERAFTFVSVIVPVNFLILMSLLFVAGSNAPTAVVMLDTGPRARQLYDAMSAAHSFRLRVASAADATDLIETGRIVAIVTIPADFDARVNAHQPVQIGVQINNLNTDFTDDIRRAIPLSITSFYAKAFPNLATVTPREIDWHPQDTDYIPYLSVSIVVVSIMVGGVLQSGIAAAKEWENGTIKELLLSPGSRWAIMVGKILGACALNLGAVALVLGVVIGVVGVRPADWGELIWATLLTMLIFVAYGTLLGALLKRRQPVAALALGLSLPIFFLSGSFGPISFNTPAVQALARLFPFYYAIVLQQHAFHGFTLNTIGVTGNALILGGYAIALLAAATLALQRGTVAH